MQTQTFRLLLPVYGDLIQDYNGTVIVTDETHKVKDLYSFLQIKILGHLYNYLYSGSNNYRQAKERALQFIPKVLQNVQNRGNALYYGDGLGACLFDVENIKDVDGPAFKNTLKCLLNKSYRVEIRENEAVAKYLYCLQWDNTTHCDKKAFSQLVEYLANKLQIEHLEENPQTAKVSVEGCMLFYEDNDGKVPILSSAQMSEPMAEWYNNEISKIKSNMELGTDTTV